MEKQRARHLNLSQLLAQFPRQHLVLASFLATALFLGLLLIPDNEAEANRHSIPLAISIESGGEPALEVTAAPEPEPAPAPQWQSVEIRPGDNLSKVFKRAGLSPRDVYEVVSTSADGDALTRIYPGQTLQFQTSAEGRLTALKHVKGRLESTLYTRADEGFISEELQREPEIRRHFASGTIDSSLFLAGAAAGMPVSLIMELANVFGGVIDFVYDVRRGDQFTVLFEEHWLDGEKIGHGPILAAQFTNRGETHKAFRYVYENGDIGYFNEEGVSMRKAFLRAPLDFTRISSGFNPRRLHPIFKTARPHRGVDYAAPTGTPVYAAGDGRVEASGYTRANGHYVVIRHGQQYTTKYLHLNKRAVRSGDKVKQRQIIGWVGSTGYATGPHLHYEFLMNGVHRNPRTIISKLPKAKSIADAEKPRFAAQISGLQLQLATYDSNRRYATADQLPTNPTL